MIELLIFMKMSCQEHLFSISNLIDANLQDNKSTFVAFIDTQKAFDWINRDLLYYRLQEYCIAGRSSMLLSLHIVTHLPW